MAVINHEYKPRGGMALLMAKIMQGQMPGVSEILLDGPAGTGKSRFTGEMLHWCCCKWPGARCLVVRQTRESLSESWMVTFEDLVLTPDCPMAHSGRRQNRSAYYYANGSEIAVGGLDKPKRLFSTEWDIVLAVEAVEMSLDSWELFYRALRRMVLPFQLLIGETNPDIPTHWLNQRCKRGQCERILTRHIDNARYYTPDGQMTREGKVYMHGLNQMSGVRRRRMLEGQWCAAEGQVWPEFDEYIHVINVLPERGIRRTRDDKPAWRMVIASVDWGWRNAGVIQVWGVDHEGTMYMLREVYRQNIPVTRQRELNKPQTQTWLQWAKGIHKTYRVNRWVCDPAEPEFISAFREAGLPAGPANNDVMAGLDAVRSRMRVQSADPPGVGDPGRPPLPRLMILRSALRERDPNLSAEDKPCSTIDEIPGYVYPIAEDGKPIKEAPDPACPDHGCDAMRYAVMAVDNIFERMHAKKRWAPKTFGAVLDDPLPGDER